MSKREIPIGDWHEAFQQATHDLAKMSLRFDPRTPMNDDDIAQRPGAYIAILSERNSVHLGLTSTPAGIRALARALLGLRHDEPLSQVEVVDGVSEVMNILAGKVKSLMSGRDGQLRLGLPMFIANPIQASGDMETRKGNVRIGTVDCELTVYRRSLEVRKAA